MTRTEPSTVTDEGVVERVLQFADTMKGVNRYYMTAQTVYEREQLIREAASGHAALLREIGDLRETLAGVRAGLAAVDDAYRFSGTISVIDAALSRP